jgi:hypothetical protein
MNRPLRLHDPVLAAALAAIAVTGCHSPMTSAFPPSPAGSEAVPPNMVPPPGHGPYTGTVADWPLWFVRHNFGAHCFDTRSCEVLYNHFPHGSDDPSPSVASYERPLDKLLPASFLSIANFPPPAVVTWRSKDGTPLRTEIDIGEIFNDRLIRHNVAREDIPEGIGIHNPDIVLEVNDRTINVYMRAFIPTKELQVPGNKHSDFRNDLIEVYSRTY